MRKTILVGENHDHELELLANGATPIRYRDLFGKDLLTMLKDSGNSKDGFDLSIASDCAPELAYVMARAAERADMNMLSKKDYIAWLEQFDPMDLLNAVEEIFNVYFGDSMTEVEPKKKGRGKQSAN